MRRGLNRQFQPSSNVFLKVSFPSYFIFTLLAAILLGAVGCKEKTALITTSEIREISREFVSAARKASDGHAEAGVRPEYAPRQPGQPQSLLADQIYITLPLTPSGSPDVAVRDAIEKEFARVAGYHQLTRVSRAGTQALERFDYFAGHRRTQSIHLITPLDSRGGAGAARAPLTPRTARLAIVMDDLGGDPAQADALFRLSYPMTISILPHHSSSTVIAEEAHRRGYEVMLHLPMASNAGDKDETIELHPGMDSAAVETTFDAMLGTVPYAAGVNNHEGSLGTSDQKLMDELMPLLHRNKLFFIDSRTTAATVAESAAHSAGVPAASRDVFLDDDQSAVAVQKQFLLAIHEAREKGSALAIGHPHPETLRVLSEMLPEAQRQGVALVYASDMAR